MFKRYLATMFVASILAALGGCATPMGQNQFGTQPYGQPTAANRPPVVDQFPHDVKPDVKVEETITPATSGRASCTLRQAGKLLAEVQVPVNVPRGDSKKFCDAWQRKEAAARGLI